MVLHAAEMMKTPESDVRQFLFWLSVSHRLTGYSFLTSVLFLESNSIGYLLTGSSRFLTGLTSGPRCSNVSWNFSTILSGKLYLKPPLISLWVLLISWQRQTNKQKTPQNEQKKECYSLSFYIDLFTSNKRIGVINKGKIYVFQLVLSENCFVWRILCFPK